MKVAVFFSGGKDSVLALQESLKKDEVRYIVSFFSEKPEPYMYNYSSMSLAIIQSLSLGLKLVTKKLEPGKEQDGIRSALESLKKEIDAVVVGVALDKRQKAMLSGICRSAGLKLVTPLARKRQDSLWKSALDAGYEILVVYSKGMDKRLLGKAVQKSDLKLLSPRKACKGDCESFRTLVINGPIFSRRMEITDSEAQWNGREGRFVIKDAKLKGADSPSGLSGAS
ncbi:MAG TPA: diphthine--ammonia ligase [archaeon]|jgi:predicted ATP pyrophosphatase (TIGR00289 family)|nr:diphthine--ammonia ligase [archaeon]